MDTPNHRQASGDLSAFNWSDLRFFLVLYRTGNPVRAGRALGVDHTTVRRRIQSLENEFGKTLFHKYANRYVLTYHGELLLEHVERMESTTIAARTELSKTETTLSATVRVGAPDGLGSYFLAPRLARLRAEHPQLNVELTAQSRQFDLGKREVDIAIVISRPPPSRHLIRKVTDCTLYLYATPEYLEQSPPIETIEDLRAHQFIGYSNLIDFIPPLDTGMPIYNELTHPGFASTNLIAQYKNALAGGGLCLLPRFMLEKDSPLQPVLKDQISVVREHWMLIHSDVGDVASYRAVINFILDQIREERDLFN